MHSPSQKYIERYSQGVILRNNTLNEYNTFLRNMGEELSLEKIAAGYVQRYGMCRVLDVGCGNGQALHELKQHAGSVVHTTGIDLLPLHDSRMLDEFIQGDAHAVPFPQNCHLLLSFRALHEMGEFSTLLPKMAHSLASGGRAYLWVRMREMIENKIQFVGEMNEGEERYLNELSSLSTLNGCKVLVEPIRQTLHHHDFVAGYVVLLLKG